MLSPRAPCQRGRGRASVQPLTWEQPGLVLASLTGLQKATEERTSHQQGVLRPSV